MKLSKERVASLATAIVDTLLKEGLITVSSKKESLIGKIESTILDDLQIEDRLNIEIRGMLKGYEREIEKGEVDYQKMFQMVKKQLVRDRNLIL